MTFGKIARAARKAAFALAQASTEQKNSALKAVARALRENEKAILAANSLDVRAARKRGDSNSLVDRLSLDEKRVAAIADSINDIVVLPDPVGEVLEDYSQKGGLHIRKVRVPLGVIGMIFEARPNVAVDAAVLCLKSGNAVILRGSSSTINSNRKIVEVMRKAISSAGLPDGSVQLFGEAGHGAVKKMFDARGMVDLIIPRGGAKLISFVVENSRVPVIETGSGICHVFVDESADTASAVRICVNAKTQRPSVCNAMESLLVHEKIARSFLPVAAKALLEKGVELRVDKKSLALLKGLAGVKAAKAKDYDTEFLDLILAVRQVGSVDEAIAHINAHGTHHSDSIVSGDEKNIRKFLANVDSAAVYANASTRFTDGGVFGLGAEMGISTQKLHCRGPFALKELTSVKFIVEGHGQVRE
ncbi:MAG: glutamate-5-semialdehyde dehydrogenase [Candidatus Diapherotrites archaeon]|nr:glutamate-5-semialdehyde dehydrogenase [Candidatus Diapherotrites archaeon]